MSRDLYAGNTQASPKIAQDHEPAAENATAAATSGAVSYCHDPEAVREWEEMVERFGYSPHWRRLYDKWQELCRAVDNGSMTLDTAIKEFEWERARTKRLEEERLRRQEVVPVG